MKKVQVMVAVVVIIILGSYLVDSIFFNGAAVTGFTTKERNQETSKRDPLQEETNLISGRVIQEKEQKKEEIEDQKEPENTQEITNTDQKENFNVSVEVTQ